MPLGFTCNTLFLGRFHDLDASVVETVPNLQHCSRRLILFIFAVLLTRCLKVDN